MAIPTKYFDVEHHVWKSRLICLYSLLINSRPPSPLLTTVSGSRTPSLLQQLLLTPVSFLPSIVSSTSMNFPSRIRDEFAFQTNFATRYSPFLLSLFTPHYSLPSSRSRRKILEKRTVIRLISWGDRKSCLRLRYIERCFVIIASGRFYREIDYRNKE